MAKKIDKEVLEEVRLKCYEVALMGIINEETLRKVKEVAENLLNNRGYVIDRVKCDFENNPPEVIDRNHVKIEIFEREFSGSQSFFIHTIIL